MTTTYTLDEIDDLRTIPEVAARIGVTDRTVRLWVEAGRLPRRKIGGRYLLHPDDVEAFLVENYPITEVFGDSPPDEGLLDELRDHLWSATEVAAKLKRSEKTLRKYLADDETGLLRSFSIGRSTYFLPADVDRWYAATAAGVEDEDE